MKGIVLALIIAGVLGLMYGGFSYTKETHEAKLGSIELSAVFVSLLFWGWLWGVWGHAVGNSDYRDRESCIAAY